MGKEEKSFAYYPHESRCFGPKAQVSSPKWCVPCKPESLWVCDTCNTRLGQYKNVNVPIYKHKIKLHNVNLG